MIQYPVSLPGGVQVAITVADGSQVWSYPNLHGDDQNAYDYPSDPINQWDLSGKAGTPCPPTVSACSTATSKGRLSSRAVGWAIGAFIATITFGFVGHGKPSGSKRMSTAPAKPVETVVYRVWGGDVDNGGSLQWGASWTPENPMLMTNPRDRLGLPNGNTGEFLTAAIAVTLPDAKRPALPYGTHGDGIPNAGGGPEWLYFNSSTVLKEIATIGVDY